MKTITASEYAELVGVSSAIVTKRLQANKLPEIQKAEKWGNTWRITIRDDFNADTAAAQFDLRKQKYKIK